MKSPGAPLSTQALMGAYASPNGEMFAINPRTGQPEPVYEIQEMTEGLGSEGMSSALQTHYYFAEDAPEGATPAPWNFAQSSGVGGTLQAIGAGLGMGGGVTGMNLGADIASGDPYMDYGDAAMLDAAGLAAGIGLGGTGVLDAGTVAAGTDEAVLLGQAAGDTVATMPPAVVDSAAVAASGQGAPIISNFAGTAGATNPMTGAPLATSLGSGGSAVSNLTGFDPNAVQLGGALLGTGLGVYGANEASNAYGDLAGQLRADRLPYLTQSQEWLANPQAYFEGPGQAALQGNLRALSIHGNPAGNPWALETANEAALRQWQNAVLGFGGLGTGGENAQVNLGTGAINAQGDIYDSIGYGIGQVTQPRTSLASLLGYGRNTVTL